MNRIVLGGIEVNDLTRLLINYDNGRLMCVLRTSRLKANLPKVFNANANNIEVSWFVRRFEKAFSDG